MFQTIDIGGKGKIAPIQKRVILKMDLPMKFKTPSERVRGAMGHGTLSNEGEGRSIQNS